ncbi:DUF3891 family protein [Virgibacillus doumboii]|uniref:DUF3891 family protein n=1 Tax=Virgibacillus doumboii TaxID=2697503 RepID=UPI0013DF900E|nr:DUF3891 family protein [Virgibacillus doumboii]
MIVRENEHDFVMIEQNYHAQISGKMATGLKDSLFSGKAFKKSVLYAIENHDYAWKLIDKEPFWNDQKQAPYTFVDFPNTPKTIFYKHGIDEVEKNDAYAGLLCSEHYSRFLSDNTSKEATAFVQQEKERRQRIIQSMDDFAEHLFDFHYGLLQFFDSLALYVCLNEPGISKENEHPFFRGGIPVSPSLTFFNDNKVPIYWKDDKTVIMNEFPFYHPLEIMIKQKRVSKDTISSQGLIGSYLRAVPEHVNIRLQSPEI